MKYGLLGKTLKHSFSKEIHALFGNHEYELIETDDLASFFHSALFAGINVTIPYKEAVLPYLNRLDESVNSSGNVNCIVRKNNELIGYNTDYYGFIELLDRNHVDFVDKKILILGNGGASKTVKSVCEHKKATVITKICRHPNGADEIPFNSIDMVNDYDIIVNTTPIGMYPNNEDSLPIDLKMLKKVTIAIDLVYNPIRTNFLLEAQKLGLKTINGLYMLVMQAKKAHELFFDTYISSDLSSFVYHQLLVNHQNIVLVGLPLSGKTKIARILHDKTGKPVIDTDALIEQEQNITVSEIFSQYGESYFRNLESDLIQRIFQNQNQIISTGGGMIENHQIMNRLRQNGVILFLDKDPGKIASHQIHHRPLIQSPQDVFRISERRRPLYLQYQDITIHVDSSTDTLIQEIEDKLNEYFNS